MRQVVVAVFDRAAQLFGRPFFVAHRAQALRSFTDEVNRTGSEFSGHPEDFDLYQLCDYDDVAGEFYARKELVARGLDVVKVVQ